jgi:hypothetical protein
MNRDALLLPAVGPRDDHMSFHVAAVGHLATIYSKESGMPKYERRDRASVDAQRRDEMISGCNLVPRERCHYCDFTVGKGALWCSTGCATDYAKERAELRAASA